MLLLRHVVCGARGARRIRSAARRVERVPGVWLSALLPQLLSMFPERFLDMQQGQNELRRGNERHRVAGRLLVS